MDLARLPGRKTVWVDNPEDVEELNADGGWQLPRRYGLDYESRESDPRPGWSVEVEVRDGAPEVRRVVVSATVDGREVRSTDLRDLHLEDLVEDTTAQVVGRASIDDAGRRLVETDFRSWRQSSRAVRLARRTRRPRITEDLLREVAAVYRAAPDRPTQAVADRFERSHSTATLYVKLARDRGFLGAAIRGKAGER